MRYFVLAVMVLLSACATAGRINRVSLGMTKEEVISVMGNPVSTSANGDTEFLSYRLSETADEAFAGVVRPYFIRVKNGKVDSYGRAGDFNSTKDPTVNVNLNKK
jgi:outer membrane protein assembly factor BamE (lipoprotein component of BamABCDE complex)